MLVTVKAPDREDLLTAEVIALAAANGEAIVLAADSDLADDFLVAMRVDRLIVTARRVTDTLRTAAGETIDRDSVVELALPVAIGSKLVPAFAASGRRFTTVSDIVVFGKQIEARIDTVHARVGP